MKIRKILSVVLCTLSVTALMTACSLGGKNDEPEFKLKSLPDIGEYQTEEIKKYFHSRPVSEIIPSDKYGEIVPFISQVKAFTSLTSESKTPTVNMPSYGFTTLDGKIISGGIYKSVKTLNSKSGKTVYIAELFMRTSKEISEIKADGINSETDIIAPDGSWAVRVSGVVTHSDEERDYIEAFDENGMKLIYDFSGNEIFNAAEAMPNEKIENVYYAKGGKFIFEVADENMGNRIICVNSKGELLTEINIRGYSVLKMLNGVFMIFKTEDCDRYNLCDLNGNIILENDFDLISYDSPSKSFICIENDKKTFYRYDINGNLINKIKTKCNGSEIQNILSGKDGASLLFKNSDGEYQLYSTLTGKKISLDLKKLKNSKNSFRLLYAHSDSGDETFILLTRKDGTQDLYDAFGTYITGMKDFKDSLARTDDGGYSYTSTDNKFVVRSYNPKNDFEIDLNTDETAEFSVDIFDSKYISFFCSDSGGENEFYKVYDFSTKEVAFDKLTAFESFTVDDKIYYAVVKDEQSELISSDGTKLISLNNDSVF